MPIVWDCHTINSDTTAILKEPTVAPYNILTIVLFSFIAVQAIEFFISAIDALVVSRTTVSLCPFNCSLLSLLSWGVFLPSPFWFLPNYMSTSSTPFYHTLYMCQQPCILIWEKQLSGFLWQHSLCCLIWQAAPNMARITNVTDSFFKPLQSPEVFGIPWLCNYHNYFNASPSHQEIILEIIFIENVWNTAYISQIPASPTSFLLTSKINFIKQK